MMSPPNETYAIKRNPHRALPPPTNPNARLSKEISNEEIRKVRPRIPTTNIKRVLLPDKRLRGPHPSERGHRHLLRRPGPAIRAATGRYFLQPRQD